MIYVNDGKVRVHDTVESNGCVENIPIEVTTISQLWDVLPKAGVQYRMVYSDIVNNELYKILPRFTSFDSAKVRYEKLKEFRDRF